MIPSEEIFISIVDDNRLVRDAIASMLDRLPDMRVIPLPIADHAASQARPPSIVLLDAGLHD